MEVREPSQNSQLGSSFMVRTPLISTGYTGKLIKLQIIRG